MPRLLELRSPCTENDQSFCINGICSYHRELNTPTCRCTKDYTGERCHHLLLDSHTEEGPERCIAIGVGILLLIGGTMGVLYCCITKRRTHFTESASYCSSFREINACICSAAVLESTQQVFGVSSSSLSLSSSRLLLLRTLFTISASESIVNPGSALSVCMDVFLMLHPPSLRDITIKMSNLYSTQIKGKQLNLQMDELRTFYGILLTSGYITVPQRHMFWSLENYVHNVSISDVIRRNRFDEIMASVHLVHNTKATGEPFYKVRPIFKELSKSYKIMPFSEWFHLLIIMGVMGSNSSLER
ncbi:hypothetical protein EOD39_7187 [Acipenser ruthenus]|uniref:EGF-like domain-containing protein n=1 Tax=Acipenser ruthenus TaxID=7906 RepID=A0A444U7X1_ACIRT|nr:hypothetical protein EOD39_7187 [Acipenser ruthenus]